MDILRELLLVPALLQRGVRP